MKKQLLLKQRGILLALLSFLCLTSIKAQTWTAPVPVGSVMTTGSQYYAFSVGAKAFIDRGGQYDTQAIVTPSTGSVITTVSSSSLWILQFETSAKCLKHDVGSGWTFTDGSTNNTWTVVETDAVNHVYSLQVPTSFTPDYNVNQFLGTSSTVYSSNNEGTVYDVRYNRTVSDYTKWMFVAAADMAMYNAKVQLDKYMNIAQLVGSSVDLTSYVTTYNTGTTADINTAVTNLKAALTVVDRTSSINNPSFTSTATTGWPGAANYGWNGTDQVLEYYRQNNKTLSQTVNGLPAGVYVVKAQGFQRCFGTATADRTAYTNGSDQQPAKLFVTASGTTSFIPLRSLFSETASPQGTLVDTYLFPNSQTSAKAAFNAGLYENELGYVTVDGTGSITFGMTVYYVASKDGEWNVVDNFRLYYYGALVVPVISTSKPSFAFVGNDTYFSDSLTVTGSNLSGAISISAPAGITVNPTSLASDASSAKVVVTYDGITSVSGNITFTSGSATTNIAITASPNTGCYTALYPSGNLVTNPLCTNIATFKNWGSGAIITGSNAYCGSSVQVTGDCGGSIDYSLTSKMLPNTTYRFKAMMFTNGNGAGISLNGCGINGTTSDYIRAVNTGSTWQAVDFTFTTGTLGAAQNFWFNSCGGTDNATDIRLDNFEIYALPSWNGTGNWSTAANWGGSVPSSGTDIYVLSGTLTINENISVANVTVSPGAALILNSGNTLTVTGNLIIKSDAAGTGIFVDANAAGGLTVGGTSTVQQYLTGADANADGIPDGQYWYLTSPVVGATSSAFTPSATANRLWSYNEAGGATSAQVYTPITVGSDVLNAGKGYVTRLTGNTTVNFAGTALVNGSLTIDLTYTPTSGKPGFNLIGNPYPSYLNIRTAFNDVAEMEKGIWYRSYAGGIMGFDTYNMTDSTQVKHDAGATVLTSLVPPMQAFWVKATAPITITLSNAMRTHEVSGNLLRSSNAEMQKIRLIVSNGVHSDETLIGFYSDASDAFDNHDSRKMFNGVASLPEIFTLAGSTEVAINGLSPLVDDKEIKLGFNTMEAGTFTIKASELLNMEEGQTVILKDKLLNVTQNLTETPEYSFTSTVTNTTDRFSLVIGKVATALATVNNPVFAVCATNGNMLEVALSGVNTNSARITVFNAIGQELASFKASGSKTVIGKRFESGVYMVKVVAPGFQATRKVIINN